MSEQKAKRSEDVLGLKWDRCLSDSVIKIAGGLGIGVIVSVFFFKTCSNGTYVGESGRPWPIAFGGGVGLGMGYANCQHEFNDPYNLRARLTKISLKTEIKPEELKIKVEEKEVKPITDNPTESSK